MKNLKKSLALLLVVFLAIFLVTCAENEPSDPSETHTPSLTGGTTYTSNSGGNKPLPGSPYGYEMWTQGGNNNTLTWYGPDQGGGAAFRAEWNNPNDFLGRVGYFWNAGKPYTYYKNVYIDYSFTRSENGTGGSYSYIGAYGWSKSDLIEWYIVDDWFGAGIMGPGTMGGGATQKGTFTVDGATYIIYQAQRVNQPSIDGTKTFNQFFSIRQTRRKSGTISVTKHFEKWAELGMNLGTNMYECKFLVEAGGGTGWLDLSWLKLSMEDTPRP